jgi:hypothetical protein
MNKYQYTDKCAEISGLGGGYEDLCRKMVIAGKEWMDEHPGADVKIVTFKGVTGVALTQTDSARELMDTMNDAVEGYCPALMIQVCGRHALYAKKHGWDAYIRRMEQLEEERVKEREQQQS